MSSTALNRSIIIASFALASCAALAADAPPRIMQEPVFGLRYEIAKVKFDPLPATALSNCPTLVDNENFRSVWFLYARARDASARTFYVAGGYSIRQNPEPPKYQKYEVGDYGVVFQTEGDRCTVIGDVREVFDARAFDETPQPILRQLAADLVSRFTDAFGGPDRLRTELRNQHVDPDRLPPELQEAFKPYFER